MWERSEADAARQGVSQGNERGFAFGDFAFLPERSLLLKNGERVRIGSRALALLGALVANVGRFVPNEDLMAAGWPGISVEDSNLRVQMTALRRLLGEEKPGSPLISNAPGRGYALTASTFSELGAGHGKPGPAPPAPLTILPVSLPVPLTPLIGRQDASALLLERLASRRLISVVGPGGIGKTRLALDACWQVLDTRSWRIVFIDLAPLTSDEFVISAIAVALGVEQTSTTPVLETVIRTLHAGETLLMLDNCEHVLDAVAELTERLLRTVPRLRVLTTSREPLRVEGEVTIRLGGLDMPEDDGALSTHNALSYPAIELFVESAAADADMHALTPEDYADISRICRRLDGIPLAIELAAARVSQFGLHELLRHVETQYNILSEGRRGSVPRHRTLRATLNWSFDGLSANEQTLLCRLALFRSSFGLDGARAVSEVAQHEALNAISSLVNKSLVVAAHGGGQVRYRLLETTRAFAEERLGESAAANDGRRLHAQYLLGLFAAGSAEPSIETWRQVIDDVRSALTWSLSDQGDPRLGVDLAVKSAPMWLRLSVLGEYAEVLESLATQLSETERLKRSELLPLYALVHHAHYHAIGLSPKLERMVTRALELARQEEDGRHELLFLYALFGTRLTQGRYDETLSYAERFADVAPRLDDGAQTAMAHRVLGLARWRSGQLHDSFSAGEAALRQTGAGPATAVQSIAFKQGVTARANHSNLLWLTGRADEALSLAQEAIAVGLETDIPGLCYSLAMTIVPLSVWTGNMERAREQVDLLLRLSRQYHLGLWLFWARCHDAVLDRLLAGTSDDFLAANIDRLDGFHRHAIATMLEEAAPGVHGLDTVSARPHWCTAELVRLKALGLAAAGEDDAAEHLLGVSLEAARNQGALAWQLRAATSLAQLQVQRGRIAQARQALLPMLEHFSQGLGTRDLLRARALATENGW